MSPRKTSRYATLVLLALLPACGGDGADAAKAALTPDIAALVPNDAVVLVHVTSFDTLQRKVDEIARAADAEGADVSRTLEMSGIPDELVDRGKPLAVAVSLLDMGQQKMPAPTFIVPVTDPDQAKSSTQGIAGSSGSHVAVTMGRQPDTGSNTLARELPAGDISIRVDLRSLLAAYRPMLEGFLSADGLAALDPSAALDTSQKKIVDNMLGWVRSFLDGPETLDAVVRIADGQVRLHFKLTGAAGSALDVGPGGQSVIALGKCLPPGDHPMVALVRGDMSSVMEMASMAQEAMIDQAPEENREAMREYLKLSREAYALMGQSLAFAGSFGDDGLQIAGIAEPTDPDAYVAKYHELLGKSEAARGFGVRMAEKRSVDVEGVSLTETRVVFDLEEMAKTDPPMPPAAQKSMDAMLGALFGEDGMRTSLGKVGRRVLYSMGGNEAFRKDAVLAAKAGSTRLGGTAGKLLAQAPDNLSCFVYLDLRHLMRWAAEMMVGAGLPVTMQVGDGAAVPLWFSLRSAGRVHDARLGLEVTGFAKLVKELQGR